MTACAPARTELAANLRRLDTDFFRALCEPARIDLLIRMVELGPADIATIAQDAPQDRSVVSRHLQVLRDTGIVQSHRDGRHVIYQVDGPEFVRRLEGLTAGVRDLAPLCCPGR